MTLQSEENHHQVWGSLAARSEALPDKLVVAIHDEQNAYRYNPSTHPLGLSETSDCEQTESGKGTSFARNMTSCAIDYRNSFEVVAIKGALDNVALGTPTSLTSHSDPALEATHDPWNFDECRSYGINRLVGEQATHSSEWPNDSFTIISLRQWIKAALDFIGRNNDGAVNTNSSAYLAPALRVALSLAKQVDVAERFASNGLFDKLDEFPIGTGSDWAGCVRVRLKANASCTPKKISAEQDKRQKPLICYDVAAVEEVNINEVGSWQDDSSEDVNIKQLGSWDDHEWQDSPLDLAIGTENGIVAEQGENKTAQTVMRN